METLTKKKRLLVIATFIVDLVGMGIVLFWLFKPDYFDGFTTWTIALFGTALVGLLMTSLTFVVYGKELKNR